MTATLDFLKHALFPYHVIEEELHYKVIGGTPEDKFQYLMTKQYVAVVSGLETPTQHIRNLLKHKVDEIVTTKRYKAVLEAERHYTTPSGDYIMVDTLLPKNKSILIVTPEGYRNLMAEGKVNLSVGIPNVNWRRRIQEKNK